jgi:hypothetical protein
MFFWICLSATQGIQVLPGCQAENEYTDIYYSRHVYKLTSKELQLTEGY